MIIWQFVCQLQTVKLKLKPHLQRCEQLDFACWHVRDVGLTNLLNLDSQQTCDRVFQLLLFLKGFTESERNKLAMLTGILLANGSISASILNSLFNENLVKEGEEKLQRR